MTKLEFDAFTAQGFVPLPGRCVILLDQPPSKIGLVHIPDSAKVQAVKAYGYLGKVLAVNPLGEWRKYYYQHTTSVGSSVKGHGRVNEVDFKVGDRVAVGLHMDDLTEEVVWARNGQVDAVVTELLGCLNCGARFEVYTDGTMEPVKTGPREVTE
jgi:hypothetical protein